MSNKIQVWDLPIRVFHWSLVGAVLAAYVTGEIGGNLSNWHGWIGALIFGLLVFRLIWGFIGTTHARFTSFFPSPARVVAYLKGEWQGTGHNPLGALSILAVLGILVFLATTGFFANDDIGFQGPLFNLIDKSLSDWLTSLHEVSFKILLVLIALHLGAIAFYFFFKKTNLVKPMITGRKLISEDTSEELQFQIKKSGKAHLLIAVLIAAISVWSVFGGVVVQHFGPKTAPTNTATPSW